MEQSEWFTSVPDIDPLLAVSEGGLGSPGGGTRAAGVAIVGDVCKA